MMRRMEQIIRKKKRKAWSLEGEKLEGGEEGRREIVRVGKGGRRWREGGGESKE